MILAIVIDTDGDEGACYELDSCTPQPVESPTGDPVPGEWFGVSEKVGDFPLSGHMVAAMIGLPIPGHTRPIDVASIDKGNPYI